MFNKINSSKLSTSIAVALLSGSAMVNPAIANDNEYFNFPTGLHEGGGVRGRGIGCVASNANNPMPFAPQNVQTLTVSESPELLFYVPDVDQASTLDVVLFDLDNNMVNRQEFPERDSSGIVSVNLVDQSNSNGLKLDSSYTWQLIQECAGSAVPNILAEGSLKRIELDKNLAEKLEFSSPSQKVKLYQAANIWHEAIANSTELKCDSNAQNIATPKWLNVENIDDNSERLFSQSLNSYCPNNIGITSIVMN